MPLRPLAESDLMRMLAWRNDPAVRGGMYNAREIGEDEHRAWFARMQDDPTARWFMHENADSTPDGLVYFTQYVPGRSAFWGFYLDPAASRGSGRLLGTDGLQLAFGALALHKLNAEVLASNERSLRFHEQMGFRREGVFVEHHFDGATYIDVVRFGLLATEWNHA
jgi:UDP-4-amino-4,6-dideoxy-N-acetyl-beta-L-altrosamine N-acetyltransferase